MTTNEMDLDAFEARAGEAWRVSPLSDDVLALVAEVRRGRDAAETLGKALSALNAALAEREAEVEKLEHEVFLRDEVIDAARGGY